MLIENSKCNTCYLCVNICPKNCIEMKLNDIGEIHPVVDTEKCNGCNLCSSKCPEITPVDRYSVQNTYASVSKDTKQLLKSTSGGIASEIAKYIISHGGVVYATVMDGLTAHFERISNLDNVVHMTGSKYIHSWFGDNLKKIKIDLIGKLTVLVIGMPCQIAAVRAYLGKNYLNLFTVDLFCHGTPAQENFRCGIALETNEMDVENVRFRDGKEYKLMISKKDGTQLTVPYRKSYWFNGFVEGYLFRECCYSCSYAGDMRVGDISLGDFWGLGSAYRTDLDITAGANAVLINNNQGAKLFEYIRDNICIEEHTLEEVKKYNHPLNAPAKKPREYNRFKKLSKKYNNRIAILFAYPQKSLYIFLRRFLSKITILYRILKKIRWLTDKL